MFLHNMLSGKHILAHVESDIFSILSFVQLTKFYELAKFHLLAILGLPFLIKLREEFPHVRRRPALSPAIVPSSIRER